MSEAPRTPAQARAERLRYGTKGRPAAQPAQPRNNGLAQIHIAKAQLGMDDDTYRSMLWAVARVRSAKDLDHAGRAKVLAHLKRSGFKPAPPKKPDPDRPHNIDSNARGPQLKKIEALLLSADRRWAYANGIAQRMFGITSIAMCDEDHLQKIIAALNYDKARRTTKGSA